MFKKLFLLVLTLTILAGGSLSYGQTVQKLQGYCEDGGQTVTTDGRTSTTKVQRSYPSCTVTVYVSGTTTLATIYSDESSTPKANPFVADSTGAWFFYGAVGRYDTRFSGGGIATPFTKSGLWVVVPGGGGGGLSGGGTTNRIAKWSGASSLDNSILNQVGTSEITLVNGRFNLQSKQQVLEVANEAVTGTTQDRLAKLTGAPSTAIVAGTSDTSGILGIVVANAGTTGSAQIAIAGRYNCEFDGATTAGNYVISSATTAGKCADGGSTPPTTRQVIGRVLSTNGASGTYEILLTGPGGYSSAGSYASGGTINPGTLNDLGYYASAGTTISPLALSSIDFRISGGTLYTKNTRKAINLIDYGADPSGVGNSTTAIQNWITDCQASHIYVCYAPGGLYLTDPITQSLNGLRLEGDGREKTVFKARVANNPVISITSANYFVNTTIDGIGFEGQGKSSGLSGHCVSISDATGGTAQFEISNASFTNCGGKGLYIPYMFAGRFRNLIFDEIGDNHMEIQGGSATIVEGVDFKTVEANKVALWIYSGNPVVTGNNGIEPDSGSGSIWGRFGRSAADGDGADSYVIGATFTGNNVEDFKGTGWQFRTGSGGSTYAGNTFISPSSGTVTALYYQFLSGTELGIWSGGTFTLQGTAAWTNSQPVHSRGYAPFYVSGTNTPTDFYEWNAAEVRSLPYVRPELLAGTTENGLKVSNFFSDAIFDSSLAGSLTGTTDPSGNASRIILQTGSASRPVYSFAGDSDTGMYNSLGNILWSTDGTLRMTLNNSYGLVLGNNSTGTGKFTAQGLSASTGFYVRTASAPGSQGGLVMPFEGGGLTFGPGIWWAGGAYNAISGLWLSNGLNWQSASSTHSQWKIRKSTGTSSEGDIVLNLHPDDGYVGFNPFGTSAGNTSESRYLELAANGTNYVGFKAPDSIAANRIWTLPSADGSASQCLQTNGSGVLSFGACGSGGGMSIGGAVTSGTAGSVLFVNSGPVLAQDNTNFYWDDTNNRLSLGGIGGAPAAPLHVLADSSNLGVRVKANAAAINVDLSSDGSVGFLGTTTNHPLELWTNSTTRVRIEAGGLVGINDATPGAQLDVTANGTGTIGAIVNGASGATADLLKLQINGTDIIRFVPVSGDVNTVLSDGALATTATDGFVYFPSMAGVPSGVPTGYTGTIPLVIDSTNSRLYGRIGGSWVNLSGGSGITIGTTTITSGTTTRVLYNNAGVVGEYAVTGTGNAVLSASPTLTGTVAAAGATFSGTITQTSASATAFESGPNGSTNPVFRLVNSTASSATGLSITGNAAGSGVTLTALSSGSNEGITINAKGTGNITINNQAVISGMTIGGNDIFRAGRVQIGTSNSSVLDFYTNNVISASIGGITGAVRSLGLGSDMSFGFVNTSSPSGASLDTTIRRAAAANLAFGAVDAASPVAQTLSVQSVVAGTSNTAGADWTLKTSAGTGTGDPGKFIIQSAKAGSSGTAQNTYATVWAIQSNQNYGAAENDLGTTSGSVTVDFKNGNFQKVTMNGNITTFTWNNIQPGAWYVVQLIQDATGGRTVAKPSNVILPGGGSGGNIPGLTGSANAKDELWCRSNGTTATCFVVADVKN